MRNLFRYWLVFALLGGGLLPPAHPARAGGPNGVVGDGTPASCTYGELLTEMGVAGYISFACGANPHTIILEAAGGMSPLAGQATTLDGGGLITLSAANVAGRRLFQIGPTAALTLTHLTLSNAVMDTYAGGALYNQGGLVLDEVTIHHAGAQGFWGGGAIYNTGHVTVRDSVLRENYSAGGGALFNEVGAGALIENSIFFSNTVADGAFGGAISNSGAMTITASTFTDNAQALVSVFCPDYLDYVCGGGALTNLATGRLAIAASTFSGNTSTAWGGGVLNKGVLSVTDTVFNGNVAQANGGALANVVTATVGLTRVRLLGNQAFQGGGLFTGYHSTATLADMTIHGNTATEHGGGIVTFMGKTLVERSTISHNTALGSAGGLYVSTSSVLTLTHVTLHGNTANANGAALWNYASRATLTHVTVSGNATANAGGAIDVEDIGNGHLFLSNVLLADNTPDNCLGPAPDTAGYNLSTDATCFSAGNGNQLSTPQLLGPLANNGGPTLTQLPAPGSAALNNGQCIGGLQFDQRGLPRLVGASCDIGAVERQAADFGWYAFLPVALR